MKRKTWWMGIVFVLLSAAMPGYVVWIVLLPHRFDPGTRSTRDDVTYYTAVAPPPEAQDIRVASFNEGQARFTLVRFTAPVEVCKKYALTVIPQATLAPLTDNQKYSDATMIYMNSERLTDLRWCDLPYVTVFWTSASGPPVFQKPDNLSLTRSPEIIGADANTEIQGYDYSGVRVDTARGIFYFLQSN